MVGEGTNVEACQEIFLQKWFLKEIKEKMSTLQQLILLEFKT